MTLEDFVHRCLLIKAGNTNLDIPCCANCEYYKCSDEPSATAKSGINTLAKFFGIEDDENPAKYECRHPVLETDDPFVAAWLETKPEDFCSRWESRNEEKEVKKENKKARRCNSTVSKKSKRNDF